MFLQWKNVLLIVPLVLYFNTNGQKLRFDRYTVDDGLQNNIVFAAAEDIKGLLWFATSTGIDRFDGSNFMHYPLPDKKNSFINYISVPFLLADKDKRIWAASANNIYKYNVQKDVFELPQAVNNWSEKSKTITGLYTGNNGRLLLIGTNNSFYVFDPAREKIISNDRFNGFVRFVFQDNKGVLWVSANKGISRFVLDNDKLNELPLENSLLVKQINGVVSGISQDMSGRYWIAMLDGRLFVYNDTANTVQSVSLSNLPGRSYAVKDVYHDPVSQSTFVSTDGGGLTVLNQDLSITAFYQSNEDDRASLSNNAVYDIFSDSYKRLWITTYGGGVNVVTPTVQPFRNFFHEINNRNSLSNNAAKAITEDREGQIWFGTRKGISRWTPLSNTWYHFNEETSGPAFTSDNILALTAGGNGDIWAGTYGGGLLRINGKTNAVNSYVFSETETSSVGTDFVYALLYDSKERLWAGGIKGTLSYFDVQKNSFTRLKTPVSSINCIIEDAQHDILLGTEKGVYKVTGDSMVNLFPQKLTDKVIYLIEEAPGMYWIGTLGGGLILADKAKGIQKIFTTKEGLPSDVICGIVKDHTGDLWVGTSKGVAHYEKANQKFTYYTKADGLAGSQVNFGAVFMTSQKEIIFGTTDGFSLFDPKRIRVRGFTPKIVFTGLTINNKQVTPADDNSLLQVQLDELATIKLKYYQNSFSVDFINTSPAVSGKHLYSWKLEGFDKDWSLPSTSPTAVYTNLETGKYTLLIKAFSKGGDDNAVVRRLSIVITPPWWLTTWAFAGYLFLLSAGVFLVYNYIRIRNARKKFAERLRLNTSISHEIRTPLTLIKGPVNALATVEGISDVQKENIQLAQKNIQKLEGILSQFIDFQKSGADKLQMQVTEDDMLHLIDDVVTSFSPLMKEKNIHFTYKRPSGKLPMLFDKDKMEKILNNLLSNAVKYTPQNRDITVEVMTDSKYMILHVKDTGIGIPQEQQQFLFKGYFRADNTVNLKETGSGIGLNVTKELVELHNGKISFESKQDKGTCFIIKLLLQNPSLQQYVVKGKTESDLLTVPVTAPKTLPKTQNKTLVIAEDNDELRHYLESQLSQSGYKVLAAADGKEAWQLVQDHLPDIVVTDVMMPHMNGFQLCMHIKRELSTSHIPVIMLTAIHDKDYLLEGYRSGADDYVRKPFDLAYILVRIENLLMNRIRFRNKIMSVFEQGTAGPDEDVDITWLKTATALIADHLNSPDFSVEKLSSLMAMSRPALFRKFKSITGESPQQFINQVRLRRAVELLQQRRMNINEVAFECGFSDPKYFSTAFKKYFGKTPSEYLQADSEPR